MPIIDNFRYRPEVDGLRAVAVLAVLLFHADFGSSGGYIGVDVFFVISGYLITSLIWKDLERGSFTFAHFWERRARRIVPALVVVTIATLLAGWFLLMPADFKSLGRASASQAVFAANIHYWFDSGYFAGVADEKPLLHTWSLAVEEQFYFIIPVLLWGVFRFAGLRTRAGVIFLFVIGSLISLAASIYGVARYPAAAFYLLPTRAWELSLGSLVAFLPISPVLLRHRSLRELFALAGLALILIPIFFYTRETPFPGLAALLPCSGTALLIWTNKRKDGSAPTAIGKLLSIGPVVFIGLISYSLYLWHWPLLAFSRYLAFTPLSVGHRVAMLGFSFLFAILSWKYVETPFRKRKLGASQKSVFAYAGAGLATVLSFGLVCMKMQGFPQRLPVQAQEFANARSDTAFQNELTTDDIRAGKLISIGLTDATQRPTVLVWGDSHAMAALPAIDAFLKEKGFVGRAATHSSTAPVLNWFTHTQFGLAEEAIAYNDSVLSYIQKQQIPVVILSANWGGYLATFVANSDSFGSALLATIRRLVAIGSRPFILLDVPYQSFDVPRALSRSIVSRANIDSLRAKPTALNNFDNLDPKIASGIEAAGGRFLDPKPRFLDPTGQYYIVHSNGIALYSDQQHLTTKGAKLVLLPFLRDSLKLIQ